MAIDGSGNLYLAVSNLNDPYSLQCGDSMTLDRISLSGAIRMISRGLKGVKSMSVDSSGNVYASDSLGLEQITPFGTVTILLSGRFGGLCIDDSGNIYVANGDSVMKFTKALVRTSFGSFSNATDVASGPAGSVFVRSSGYVWNTSDTYLLRGDGTQALLTRGSKASAIESINGGLTLFTLNDDGTVDRIASSPTTKSTTSSNFSISGLVPGDGYSISITATNASSQTENLGTWFVKPNFPTLPGPPIGFSASILNPGIATLAFSPPALDGGAQISDYVVTATDVTSPYRAVSESSVAPSCLGVGAGVSNRLARADLAGDIFIVDTCLSGKAQIYERTIK